MRPLPCLFWFVPALVHAQAAVGPPASPAFSPRAFVHHVPPAEAEAGTALRLVAAVDRAWIESAIVARYRRAGAGGRFLEAAFERSSAGGWFATVPGRDVERPGVEYHVVGRLPDGTEVAHFASADAPHRVRVEPPRTERWREAERRRLNGREARLRLWTEGQLFGSERGRDRYGRGEIDWTYRPVTTLYSFALGYGTIEGTTPATRGPGMPIETVDRGIRYGFGEIRLRGAASLWVDVGVLMGFSHVGFDVGARGQLTFGKDWRSCAQVGAETIGDLGSSAWVRLQWDTAPPFLMGATVRGTDLPGTVLPGGMQLVYDITYPVSERLSITAKVAYAARRDTTGQLGGGLGTAVEF